jgi:hypothetical protein
VVGSRSGPHAGKLITLADGHGSMFLPDRPFAAGDRVSVKAALISPVTGRAVGAAGVKTVSFSFAIATPIPAPALPRRTADRFAPAGAGPPKASIAHMAHQSAVPTHSFRTVNSFHPPLVYHSGHDRDQASGYVFGDVENSIQAGPIILSSSGQLVWFQPLRRAAAFNVEVQQYDNQSVLTYWQGYVTSSGYGVGNDVLLDHSYQQIATVRAADGLSADLHEFQITPQGTALITAYEPVHADLRPVGGPRHGILLDSVVQEIDIRTGALLWEWHAYGHVRISTSYTPEVTGKPYDFFHVNSVQQLPNGNLLVSARNTWAVYEIDKRTGRISWQLGGKHSTFKLGPGANFEWQHDATILPDGTLVLFDDAEAGDQVSEKASRAMWIRLNLRKRRAKLLRQEGNTPPLLSGSQGSVQVLPNGNWFVGWGAMPYFTEFAPNGRQLFSLHFPSPMQSYRGLRFQWWGQPSTPPSIAVSPTQQGTRVYASWNGATGVVMWRVLAGPNPSSMQQVGQFPKTTFESGTWIETTQPYISVQALGTNGQILSTSPTVNR